MHHAAQEKFERVFHGHNLGTMRGNGEFTDGLEISQLPDFKVVRGGGFEPPRSYPLDPKSSASASSATLACLITGLLKYPSRPG